ncbi:MAG: hypothetical protein RhofKO_32830 [Rhodothermales bacterium]
MTKALSGIEIDKFEAAANASDTIRDTIARFGHTLEPEHIIMSDILSQRTNRLNNIIKKGSIDPTEVSEAFMDMHDVFEDLSNAMDARSVIAQTKARN